jgi:hypothetical protein
MTGVVGGIVPGFWVTMTGSWVTGPVVAGKGLVCVVPGALLGDVWSAEACTTMFAWLVVGDLAGP